MSPAMQDFLQASLISNRFTKEVDSIRREHDAAIQVIGQGNTSISVDELEKTLVEGVDEKELEFKEVVAKMIPIQWIYQS